MVPIWSSCTILDLELDLELDQIVHSNEGMLYFKNDEGAYVKHGSAGKYHGDVSIENEVCSKDDECCGQNDEFCVNNDEFCIKNDENSFRSWKRCSERRTRTAVARCVL